MNFSFNKNNNIPKVQYFPSQNFVLGIIFFGVKISTLLKTIINVKAAEVLWYLLNSRYMSRYVCRYWSGERHWEFETSKKKKGFMGLVETWSTLIIDAQLRETPPNFFASTWSQSDHQSSACDQFIEAPLLVVTSFRVLSLHAHKLLKKAWWTNYSIEK